MVIKKDKDIHFRIEKKKFLILKQLAKKEYRTITSIVEEALDWYFENIK